jgi:hypothetical protein
MVALVFSVSGASAAEKVSIELVLATDTSISVDAAEFHLQMSGIAAAFRNSEIIDLIESLPNGAAVCLVHWSVGHLNRVAVPWFHVTDRQSALLFAALVELAPRINTGRGTGIADAIDFSARQIEIGPYEGQVRKIDVSGDERSNSGPPTYQARDRAVDAGLTINGLSIQGLDRYLHQYYREQVIGGPSAFAMTIGGFEDFRRAIHLKLLRELAPSASMDDAPGASQWSVASNPLPREIDDTGQQN